MPKAPVHICLLSDLLNGYIYYLFYSFRLIRDSDGEYWKVHFFYSLILNEFDKVQVYIELIGMYQIFSRIIVVRALYLKLKFFVWFQSSSDTVQLTDGQLKGGTIVIVFNAVLNCYLKWHSLGGHHNQGRLLLPCQRVG